MVVGSDMKRTECRTTEWTPALGQQKCIAQQAKRRNSTKHGRIRSRGYTQQSLALKEAKGVQEVQQHKGKAVRPIWTPSSHSPFVSPLLAKIRIDRKTSLLTISPTHQSRHSNLTTNSSTVSSLVELTRDSTRPSFVVSICRRSTSPPFPSPASST